MYCTRCGFETGELDRFCSQCGNPAPLGVTQSPVASSFTAVGPPPLPQAGTHAPLLARSLRNRKIAGVCAGIGRHFGVDPTLVRILFVVMFFCPLLPAIIPYIVCWIVMPLEQPEPVRQAAASAYPMPSQPYAPMAR